MQTRPGWRLRPAANGGRLAQPRPSADRHAPPRGVTSGQTTPRRRANARRQSQLAGRERIVTAQERAANASGDTMVWKPERLFQEHVSNSKEPGSRGNSETVGKCLRRRHGGSPTGGSSPMPPRIPLATSDSSTSEVLHCRSTRTRRWPANPAGHWSRTPQV